MKITVSLTTATLIALTGLAVSGCSSSGSSTTTSTPPVASSAAAAASSAEPSRVLISPTHPAATPTAVSTAPVDGTTYRYQKIVEPFSDPGTCNDAGTTIEMTACILEQVVDVDSTIDAAQLQRFEKAPSAQQAGLLAEDARWLSNRSKHCAAQAKTGGSIDQITDAECLLKTSKTRAKSLS